MISNTERKRKGILISEGRNDCAYSHMWSCSLQFNFKDGITVSIGHRVWVPMTFQGG